MGPGRREEPALTPDKTEPMLPDNLYEPTAGDQGARGIFSDRARSMSPQVWYTRHRALTVGAGLGAAVAATAAVVGRVTRGGRA